MNTLLHVSDELAGDDSPAQPWHGLTSIAGALILLLALMGALFAVLVLASPTLWRSAQELRVLSLISGKETTSVEFGPADFIEIETPDCDGGCLGYRLRLLGDGRMQSTGTGFTCAEGPREVRLDPMAARRFMAALHVAVQPLDRGPAVARSRALAWIGFSRAGQQTAHGYSWLPAWGERMALLHVLLTLQEMALDPAWRPEMGGAGEFYCARADGNRRKIAVPPWSGRID